MAAFGVGPLERRVVGEGMRQLVKTLDARAFEAKAAERAASKADWRRVHMRFDPRTDDEMRQRLGYTVGDSEGDADVA